MGKGKGKGKGRGKENQRGTEAQTYTYTHTNTHTHTRTHTRTHTHTHTHEHEHTHTHARLAVIALGLKIDPAKVSRVFVLGPSHHVYIRGCALTPASSYETPIGNITIDKEINSELESTDKFERVRLMPNPRVPSCCVVCLCVRVCWEKPFFFTSLLSSPLSLSLFEQKGNCCLAAHCFPSAVFFLSLIHCPFILRFRWTQSQMRMSTALRCSCHTLPRYDAVSKAPTPPMPFTQTCRLTDSLTHRLTDSHTHLHVCLHTPGDGGSRVYPRACARWCSGRRPGEAVRQHLCPLPRRPCKPVCHQLRLLPLGSPLWIHIRASRPRRNPQGN